MRFNSLLKKVCGAVATLSSSAAERGIANTIVPVATSATIIDKSQEKTYIASYLVCLICARKRERLMSRLRFDGVPHSPADGGM
ncbi:hypothetical protein YK56LOC_16090 [Caballeronia sp. HLA56]